MNYLSQVAPLFNLRTLVACTLLAAPLAGQSMSFAEGGDTSTDFFGWTVDGGADIDGDGLPDVVVGGYRASTGRIKVFSGLTGATLLHIVGAPSEGIGFEVAFVHDVNGDGTPDILASSHLGHPNLYSGLDGSVLMTFGHGSTFSIPGGISGFPDDNGDGIEEMMVGNSI